MPIARRILAATIAAAALSAPARAAETLAPPIARTPAEPIGTVVLLPASGWASPSVHAQQTIWSRMAPTLFGAGYRTVAVDYARGATEALGSIRQVVRTERRRTEGPLCLYGESSGGHLAVITALRMRGAVDCVITFGAPFSFHALAEESAAHPEALGYLNTLEAAIRPTFGADPSGWAGWEPADALTPMPMPTLAMICADDPLVPPDQVRMLPGAETFVPASGHRQYVHGTVSGVSLRAVRARILAFLSERRS